MNGSLSTLIARQLMPALEQSQGVEGSYVRGDVLQRLVAIPTKPDWVSEAEQGAGVLQWRGLVFEVSAARWNATGFGLPEQGDTFTAILGDGRAQTYGLLPPKGKRPYELSADGETYFFNMKVVSA